MTLRNAVSSVALAAAVALAVSAAPASASTESASVRAAVSRGAEAAPWQQPVPPQAFHPGAGQSVRITANGQVIPAKGPASTPSNVGPYNICLYHSENSCAGVSALSPSDIKIIINTVPNDWIEWEVLTSNGDKDDNVGTVGGVADPGRNLCLAAAGLNQQLLQTSCNATSGNYWQYQRISGTDGKAWHYWNTKYHCFMTTHATTTGNLVRCTALSSEPWSTWTYLTLP